MPLSLISIQRDFVRVKRKLDSLLMRSQVASVVADKAFHARLAEVFAE